MRYMPSVFAVVALWLMAAPFLLGYADSTIAMRNDVAVGAVILIAALWWGLRELKDHGWFLSTQKR